METNLFDLGAFIGKTVILKAANTGTLTCTLEGVHTLGAIVTAETFKNRLIPWSSIDYVDLVVVSAAKTRVA